MTSVQLTEWLAYASLEPFGYSTDNYRAATIAKTVANYSQRSKQWKSEKDFMPPPITRPKSVAVRIAEIFGVPMKDVN